MKEKYYHLSDLERLGATFIIEKLEHKRLFRSYYSGSLVINDKVYRVGVMYDGIGVGYLLGALGENRNESYNEIHDFIIECAESEKYPAFGKAVYARTIQKLLFGILMVICALMAIYFGRILIALPIRANIVSFILPMIGLIIAIYAYYRSCLI